MVKRYKKLIKKFILKNIWTILALILLLPVFFILYKDYIPRANAFGCFDDCNNFMRGYFVLHGNALFSQVFSGHQPLGSYLSALVQWTTNPPNIHELILRHRQFVIIFAFIFNILLIFRFGPKIILFTILYEFSKFYIFGDRFLGEAMAIYPSVYLAGIVIKRIIKERIYKFDYYLTAIFCWFIVFTRAPFIPMALVSYFFILIELPLKKVKKEALISIGLFAMLSGITVFSHDVRDYYYNVIYFNSQINIGAETKLPMAGPRIFHWFFYPVYILFYGKIEGFKLLLLSIDVVFLGIFIGLLKKRKYLIAGFIFLILGLSNLRPIVPGTVFYSAFHSIIWYGLFVFITVFFLFRKGGNKLFAFLGFLVILISFSAFVMSPKYFARENVSTYEEFITNYGFVMSRGDVIRELSKPGDTLFLDDSDDLIYWQAKLFSNYKYSWYTSAMPALKLFTDERMRMFSQSPPDFYREYGTCPKKKDPGPNYRLPDFVKGDYVRLSFRGRESCLFVYKDKIKEITDSQWAKAEEIGFSLKK